MLEVYYTQGDNDVISIPAGCRRHLVGKTIRNVFHCDIAKTHFVGKLVTIDIFINQRIACYLNNTKNLRRLCILHIMPWHTHKMAVDRIVATDSVTSLHPMYKQIYMLSYLRSFFK